MFPQSFSPPTFIVDAEGRNTLIGSSVTSPSLPLTAKGRGEGGREVRREGWEEGGGRLRKEGCRSVERKGKKKVSCLSVCLSVWWSLVVVNPSSSSSPPWVVLMQIAEWVNAFFLGFITYSVCLSVCLLLSLSLSLSFSLSLFLFLSLILSLFMCFFYSFLIIIIMRINRNALQNVV